MSFTSKAWKYLPAVALSLFLLPALTFAQYTRTDLVTDTGVGGTLADSALVNGWGLTRSDGGSPFWVSDNSTGKSTLYNGAGQKQGLVVTIPPAPSTPPPAPGTPALGTPTGTVFNITLSNHVPSFVLPNGHPAIFLFATLDGTISGWNGGPTAVIPPPADQSAFGAVYTGLAITSDGNGGDFLYATDNGPNSRIDVFNKNFERINSFTDPAIPSDLAPYGIQNIKGNLWVTFGGNTKSRAGGTGFVDEFDAAGNVILRIGGDAPLHSPWGLAMAPPNFGQFSNALLVANNIPKGKIDAFDPTTGAFLGTLRDPTGQEIVINQVWALQFGNGGNGGKPNQLFFTAGPNNYANGLFGKIEAAQ